jgi:hypothetical protein
VRNGSSWSALVQHVFYPPQDLSKLVLTEVMFNPPGAGITNSDEFEFIEFKNIGTNTLNLSGLTFTAGIDFTFTNNTILPTNAFLVVGRNSAALQMRYPGLAIQGLYVGRLDNGGEALTLSLPAGGELFSLRYDDEAPWPVTPDGSGYSLVPAAGVTTPASDDGTRWRASTYWGGSPGADDPAPVVAPLLITEVLTHTDPPLVDAVEIHNPTATNVNLGGWFLTDDPSSPKQYRIPNRVLTPGGYTVIDAHQFNPVPGVPPSFAFSELGESVYLFSGDANTNLTGYSHGFSFQAADWGVSFGRYANSAGDITFPAQMVNTLGTNNAGPRVSSLVLSEIYYHPDTNGCEFVEIHNPSGTSVPLFDPATPTNHWRIGGVGFVFPAGISVPANGYVVVTATNEAAFRALFSVPAQVQVFGPYSGALQDSGELLELAKPALADTNGSGWVVMDEVRYNDKAPWPPAADGGGLSLQRVNLQGYGNEPLHWVSGAPTPGAAAGPQDGDNDAIHDDWELAYGLDPQDPFDAQEDDDADSLTNYEEFIAGTNPHSASSVLALQAALVGNAPVLSFTAGSNVIYSIESAALPGAWTNVITWPAATTNRSIQLPVNPNAASELFYRLKATRE